MGTERGAENERLMLARDFYAGVLSSLYKVGLEDQRMARYVNSIELTVKYGAPFRWEELE
jgi:hypothetical protein